MIIIIRPCAGSFCFFLLPLLTLEAAEKKPSAISIRLYAEGNPREGETFVVPVTLINPPKQTVIRKVPIVTERDVVAFYPFAAGDGTIGCYFKLDADGTNKLMQHTVEFRDTLVVAMINGRVACAMMVGQKMTDGIMPFPIGISSAGNRRASSALSDHGQGKGVSRTEEKSAGGSQGGQKAGAEGQANAQERAAMTAARAAAYFFLVLGALRAEPLVDFPTDNRALLEGRPQDFFMYVNRDFEGEKSKPWQGGQFGFVRGPVRDGGKILCIQFHEGIDIRPVHRDAQGNPTDEVRAAAAGTVVHVSREARRLELREVYRRRAQLGRLPILHSLRTSRFHLGRIGPVPAPGRTPRASWASRAPESTGNALTRTSRSA